MQGESLGLLVAFSAGLLSFLSPCVLPLVPSYASFITGLSLDDLAGKTDADRGAVNRTVLVHGLLFVGGFSAVFIALGASATLLGSMLSFYSTAVQRIGGVIIIVFALYLIGWLKLPGAERDVRVHVARKPIGYFGTLFVGVAFGAGWTPCIGPVLGGILTLAATRESMSDGIWLLSSYSAGLAVPFLLATLALDRFLAASSRFRAWMPWVQKASGVLLLLVGILLLTGSFTFLSSLFARWTPGFILERI